MNENYKETNPVIEWLLCLFLGYFGAHKFYAGKKKMGIIYVFTVGLFAYGWLFDLIVLSVKLISRFASNKKSAKHIAQPQNHTVRSLTEETFHAVGVSYYENNIRKLACPNPDWKLKATQIIKEGKAGRRIFKNNYVNRPVKLVQEPDNPHDKNAIAVIIAGELVGYISREDNLHVKDILENREIKHISGFIGGGEYKIIDEDGDTVKDESGFSINVRVKYI